MRRVIIKSCFFDTGDDIEMISFHLLWIQSFENLRYSTINIAIVFSQQSNSKLITESKALSKVLMHISSHVLYYDLPFHGFVSFAGQRDLAQGCDVCWELKLD